MSLDTTTPPPPPPNSANLDGGRRAIVRMAALGVVLAAAATAFSLSPVRPWLGDAEAVRRTLWAWGAWAYPACVVVVALLVACGAPRLLLAALGAMVLGFWWGLALTQAGALLGYYAVFLLVRWGGGDWATRRWPRLRPWAELLRGQGVVGVILVRQIPVHGTLLNMCLGLSGVRHRHFLIGSAIGLLPEAIPVALVGAGLARGSLRESAPYVAAGVVAFILVGVALARALRAWRGTRVGAALIGQVTTSTEGASC